MTTLLAHVHSATNQHPQPLSACPATLSPACTAASPGPQKSVWVVELGIVFPGELSPAFPTAPVPVPPLTQLSSPLPRITNPRGSRQKNLDSRSDSQFLICFILKKREGVAVRQPDGTLWQPAAESARPRRPSGSRGSALQQPVQAPRGSRLSTESTSNSSQMGHSRFAHAQEARTEMSHPQAETLHGYGGDDQAQGHAHLAHADTGAP